MIDLPIALLFICMPPSVALTRLLWSMGTTVSPVIPTKAAELAALEMPDLILDLIEAESEEWARADLRAEALHLHDLLDGSWEHVHRELTRRHQRPDPAATDKAWEKSAESLAEAAA